MNIFVCGNCVTYYVWSSYILTEYISSKKFLNYGHDEMHGDFHQQAILRLSKYKTLFYTNTFIAKNISTHARKRSGKT